MAQDKTDDVLVSVKSTALLFGDQSRIILTGFSLSFLSLLSTAGYMNGQGPLFYSLSVGGAAAHLAWQLRTVDFDSRPDCWAKFCSNSKLGAIVWSGLVADYAFKVGTVAAVAL